MGETELIRPHVPPAHRVLAEHVDQEMGSSLSTRFIRCAGRTAFAPRKRQPSAPVPSTAHSAYKERLKPGQVALGEPSIDIGDGSTRPLVDGDSMKEPGVVAAETPSAEEAQPELAGFLALPPESLHPAPIVSSRSAAKRTAGMGHRLDDLVAEDVWRRGPRLSLAPS
jgi:hypothetical protein